MSEDELDVTKLVPRPAPPDLMSAGGNPDAPLPYRFGVEIARGGMGSILQAEDCKLPRTVAVKIILAEIDADEAMKQRFINEAAVLARLAHPNIVPIYDIGRDEQGQLFYSMKLVRGRTLKSILQEIRDGIKSGDGNLVARASSQGGPSSSPYTLDRLLTIFCKVCDAMAFAHSKGIIHRDLKPDNIMVGEFGEVLVMDWGLAKALSEPEDTLASTVAPGGSLASRTSESSLGMTMEGSVLGTPQYMSPEQAEGRIADMDARSDIFSLGGILYSILTLRPPVEGKSLQEVLRKVATGEIAPPSAYGATTGRGKGKSGPKGEVLEAKLIKPLPHCPGGRVPAALSAVAMQALAVQLEARYQTVAVLSADIEAYQRGFATSAEHAGLMTQIILLVKRHKGIFSTAFTAWLLISALAAWFVISIRASERETRRQAEIAQENEAKAEQNARIAQENERLAVTNERRAAASEKEAVAEKENVRRALAKSALALGEAAYREADGPAMQSALDTVPADLRDANWTYLLEQSDTSLARLPNQGLRHGRIVAHPKLPSVFGVSGGKPQVELYNVRTGERVLQFGVDLNPGGGNPLNIAISPDGERVAVGSGGRAGKLQALAIHSAKDGTKLLSWPCVPVAQLQFSADGRHLLHLCRDRGEGRQSLTLWDTTNGKEAWSFQLDTPNPLHGRFMPDGKQVLAASGFGRVARIDIKDGTVTWLSGVKVSGIVALAVRPDGSAFVWANGRGDIHCVDFAEGRLLFSDYSGSGTLKHLEFMPDGQAFVSVAERSDGRQSITLRNARTGTLLNSIIGGRGSATTIDIHPLSGELVVGGQVGRAWDLAGTPAKWTLASPTGSVVLGSAAFWGSDERILGPANGFRSSLIDLRNMSVIWQPATIGHNNASISADGRVAAIHTKGGKTGHVQVAKLEGDKVLPAGEFTLPALPMIRLSPAGDRLAIISQNATYPCSIVNSSTGAQIAALDTKSMPQIHDVCWRDSGNQLFGLVTSNKKRGVEKSEEQIVIWDAATGQQVRAVAHPTALDCMVAAPDGKCFAVAGVDKLVHLFDSETLAERQAFRAHDGPITALAWHPTRPIVATASADLTIKIWNVQTGKRLDTLRGPSAAPRVLNFSPSGQRLACASEDRVVRIWEPKSLSNAVLDAPAADGWEDIFAKLKTDEVKANGNGWTLSGGILISPEGIQLRLTLPGSYARGSYQIRATVRKLVPSKPKSVFAIILPVADSQVSFLLDASYDKGKEEVTGLSMVDGKIGYDIPDIKRGLQINDSDPHELEITVRLSARTALITATLDDRPLYEWSGLPSSLRLVSGWQSATQPQLHLGASGPNWVVSAVKVRRL